MESNLALYEQLIDEKSIKSLRDILDVSLYQIYSPAINIHGDELTSTSFSIHAKKNWLNFYNEWLETPKDSSYYKLIVEESEVPYRINYDKAKNILSDPVSSITFNTTGDDGMKICSVEFFSKEEVWNNEKLFYDYAIISTAQNGFKICLYVLEQISDMIQLTLKKELIEKVTSECKLRVTLKD